MREQKAELRQNMLHYLRTIEETQFKKKCAQISARLIMDPLWQSARVVAVTISMAREVETRSLIESAWASGKKVAVPQCEPKTKTLMFCPIDSFSSLKPGHLGLMEPDVSKTGRIDPADLELVIVPGVVFDRRGFRIGYGGGYYDRLLSIYQGPTLSLLLSDQFIDQIPAEAHDKKVQVLLTEKDRIETGGFAGHAYRNKGERAD